MGEGVCSWGRAGLPGVGLGDVCKAPGLGACRAGDPRWSNERNSAGLAQAC